MIDNAANLNIDINPPAANVLIKYIYVLFISVVPIYSLCTLFSSNQLSIYNFTSTWSWKFDGLVGVIKNFGDGNILCVEKSFSEALR